MKRSQLLHFTHDKRGQEALVIPFWKGKKGAICACNAKEIRHAEIALKTGDFQGIESETLWIYANCPEKRILLLGLGDEEKFSPEVYRKCYGKIVNALQGRKVLRIGVYLPERHSHPDHYAAEGLFSANYRFTEYKEKISKTALEEIHFINSPRGISFEHVEQLFKGIYLTRDLVNRNAAEVTTDALVKVAKDIAKKHPHIKTTIFDKKRLEKEGFGLHLAVGQGSKQPPYLIIAKYQGDPHSKEHLVIVGKGVTYDTGGLNLKTDMMTMKSDMAAAAACLGLLEVAAEQKLKRNFTIVIPTVENAIGSNSYKPGDAIRSYSGKWIEIGNTDAEGRLILADALSYVVKHLNPSKIIDLATLTGAIVIALGNDVAGLFSNHESLALKLLKAGEKTGEKLCRLPLVDSYRDALKSDIADWVNVGGRPGSSIKAALFLQEFVGDVPWAHLDIAGVAFRTEAPKHATGFGVRLLMEYLYDNEH